VRLVDRYPDMQVRRWEWIPELDSPASCRRSMRQDVYGDREAAVAGLGRTVIDVNPRAVAHWGPCAGRGRRHEYRVCASGFADGEARWAHVIRAYAITIIITVVA
jgi:hypothetical protein